jgi:diguanylate cyclase (GGDEF)-like protein
MLALSSALQAQQYVFRAYRQAEGLKNLAVNALARDRDGFLWVATENGVYRFIGSGFQRFGREQGIAELDVQDVVADPSGTVWVGTGENLYRWDGQRFLPAGQNPIHFLGPNRIAVEDAGHLLVVDNRQIYRLEHDADGRILSFLPVLSARLLAEIPDLGQVSSVSVVNQRSSGSRVWIGCGKQLCSWLDGETRAPGQPRDGAVTHWGSDQGLPPDHWVGAIEDRTGTLWAGGRDHVFVLPAGATRFVSRNIPGSDPESLYGHAPLIEDREGRILAPAEEGIARWNGSGWQFVGQANGLLHSSHVMGMVFDAAGDLWLASHGDGLYEWTGYEDWAGWGNGQGLPSASVWSIVASRPDRVFVGTDKGPAWIDPRGGASGPLFQGTRWSYGQVGSMGMDQDGSLWAGTFSGAVLRIDPKTGRTVQTARLPSEIIFAIQDSSGRVFFTTNQGIYVREAGAVAAAPHRVAAVDALLGASTRVEAACAAPDGTIWFTANNRVLRYRDGQWTAPPIRGMSTLQGSLLAVSCAPDGALWVTGEQAGIWRMTAAGDHLQASQLQFPTELRSLAPLAILTDRRGWVWLGTDLGLMVWNGHSWRHLTQESGLIWNDVSQGALRMAPDGSLWVGTSGGVAHLLHPEHVFDPVSIAISITDIRHENDLYSGAQQIVLPWPGTPLHFQVASPAMRNRSELSLRIWMVGLQQGWLETQSGIATFSRLSPGDYTFMTIACNPGLEACSGTAKVKVRILPPWWMTYWFYAACAVAFLLLLVAADRLRARNLRQRSRNLERLVGKRTQELEASREKLRVQATHDGMTGMFNRTAVLRALTTEMDRARRERGTLLVALVDLDYFKRVNDTYGHLAGDEALRCFAAAVAAAIRPYDHAGRYGGEEFLLVLTQIPPQAIVQRLTSLHAAISNLHVRAGESVFTVNCSMGATVLRPTDGSATVESLLALADQALYAAKASGRNRMVFRHAGWHAAGQSNPPTPTPTAR